MLSPHTGQVIVDLLPIDIIDKNSNLSDFFDKEVYMSKRL